jgi:methionine-rich copper-binding protein CopC
MRSCGRANVRIFVGIAMFLMVLIAGASAEAHAILKESSPAANSTVKGPDVTVTLKFNVRIDSVRSKLRLLHPDATTTNLAIENQTSADVLTTTLTELKAGPYEVQWQVLAPDGHITRGVVPFIVSGF